MDDSSSVGMLLSTIFGSVGVILLIVAAAIAFFTLRHMRAIEAKIAQLQPASARTVAATPAGQTLLIEGRVSRRMKTLHGPFVAYSEKWDGSTPTDWEDDDSDQTLDDTSDEASDELEDVKFGFEGEEQPPLLIELPDGTVEVGEGYWLEVEARPLAEENGKQYHGLTPSEPVVVVGTVAQGEEFPRLVAATVMNPPRDRYAAKLRGNAKFGFLPVAICGGVGLIFVVVAAVLFILLG